MTAKYTIPLQYGEMDVTCNFCGATFSWRELKGADEITEDWGDTSSEKVCPKCGEWDCCDIEWEK